MNVKLSLGRVSGIAVAVFASVALQACAPKTTATAMTRRIGPEFQMSPEDASHAPSDIPGLKDMSEIVRVGARAMKWADTIQNEIPVDQRQQIWRRQDQQGNEPSPQNPKVYNPSIISGHFADATKNLPTGMDPIIRGTGDLPTAVPQGSTLDQVMQAIRAIRKPYAEASRWIQLYPYHVEMDQDQSDLRPWMAIRDHQSDLLNQAHQWASLNATQRQQWIDQVSAACPISGTTVASCKSQASSWKNSSDSAKPIAFFQHAFDQGKPVYDFHFGVQTKHPDVLTEKHGNIVDITFQTYQIPEAVQTWIDQNVSEGWTFADLLVVHVKPSPEELPGSIEVLWKEGVTPNADAIGGNHITMDSNEALWLELTQVTIKHEFGHLMGFDDCYVEFWDASIQSFTSYALDPEDRMCALSGGQKESHRTSLISAYSQQ